MGLYRRNKIWWVCYSDGEEYHRESSHSELKKDAEALLMARKRAVLEGRNPEIKRIGNHTFYELCDRYLEYISRRENGAEVKTYVIRKMQKHFDRNPPLKAFTHKALEEYQSRLLENLSNSTVNKRLSILKVMFKKAVEWEMAGTDILKNIDKIKSIKGENEILRFLSRDEYKRLITACEELKKTIPLDKMVDLSLTTGLRKTELLTLKWSFIDLESRIISLPKTKSLKRQEIFLIDKALLVLKSIEPNGEYVFPNPQGKPFRNIKPAFNAAKKRAGVENFRWHDLRHTFCSWLALSGVPLKGVQKIARHSSIMTTMRYIHLSPENETEYIMRLDNYF